jgi:hypothetical protein
MWCVRQLGKGFELSFNTDGDYVIVRTKDSCGSSPKAEKFDTGQMMLN